VFTLDLARAQMLELERVAEIARRSPRPTRRSRRFLRSR
jgi:hypothetical protein